jgi:hypothetical protein
MIPRQIIGYFLALLFLSSSVVRTWPCCANQLICPEAIEETALHHHHSHEIDCAIIDPQCEKPFHHKDHCDKNLLDFLICLINLAEKPYLNVPFVKSCKKESIQDRLTTSNDQEIYPAHTMIFTPTDRLEKLFKCVVDTPVILKSWRPALPPERGPPDHSF